MTTENEAVQEILSGPKPVSVEITTRDVQMLYACQTSPKAYMQLILAKLKDAGAPVEGALNLRVAHGKVFKMKDNPMEEQSSFVYIWIPDAYIEGMRGGLQEAQA